jgi:hypothetical protein
MSRSLRRGLVVIGVWIICIRVDVIVDLRCLGYMTIAAKLVRQLAGIPVWRRVVLELTRYFGLLGLGPAAPHGSTPSKAVFGNLSRR